MAATLKAVRDQIATLWAALTPPTNASVLYAHQTDERPAQAVTADRGFWFELPAADHLSDYGAATTVEVWALSGRMRLETAGRSTVAQLDRCVDEGVQIQSAINRQTSWPAGTDYVRCTRFRTERTKENQLDLVFTLEIRTLEA